MSESHGPQSAGSVTKTLLAPGDALRESWSTLPRAAKWVVGVAGFGLLALLSLVVAVLAFRTLVAIRRQEICVPE